MAHIHNIFAALLYATRQAVSIYRHTRQRQRARSIVDTGPF